MPASHLLIKMKKTIIISLIATSCLMSCSTGKEELLPNGKTVSETIGFTTAAGYYAFDDELSCMEEGADRILEMGSSVIKLWFTANPAACYPYNTDWASCPQKNNIDLLESPYYKATLAKPFKTFVLETHTFDASQPQFEVNWYDGMTEDESERVEREMYELAKYLFINYDGTGKTFLLQNWEGDNSIGNEHWTYNAGKDFYHLEKVALEDADDETDKKIKTAFRGMIDWFNARQKGVDKARAELAGKVSDVYVWHVLEANFTRADELDDEYEGHPLLITPWVAEDTPMLIEKVVPYTDCDLYSLSCWGATSVARANTMQRRLDQYEECIGDTYIDLNDGGKVKQRRPFYRKGQVSRLMLGEYGTAERAQSGDRAWEYTASLTAETDRRQREVAQIQTDIALAHGLEYIIYWQIYCNDPLKDIEDPITPAEMAAGRFAETRQLKGYWVIRPDGSFTETYKYFRGLLDKTSLYVEAPLKTGREYVVDGVPGGVELSAEYESGTALSNIEGEKIFDDALVLLCSKDGKEYTQVPLTAYYTNSYGYGSFLRSDLVFVNSFPLDPGYRYFKVESGTDVSGISLHGIKLYRPNPENLVVKK